MNKRLVWILKVSILFLVMAFYIIMYALTPLFTSA